MWLPIRSRVCRALSVLDLMAIGCGALVARELSQPDASCFEWMPNQGASTPWAFSLQVSIVFCLWLVIAMRDQLFDVPGSARSLLRSFHCVTKSWLKTLGFGAFLGLSLWGGLAFHPVLTALFALAFLVALRFFHWSFQRLRDVSDVDLVQALVICSREHAAQVTRSMGGQPASGIKVVGWLGFGPQDREGGEAGPSLGQVADLQRVCAERAVQTVILCPAPEVAGADAQRVIELCDEAGIECHYLPFVKLPSYLHPQMEWDTGLPRIAFRSQAALTLKLVLKHAMDIALASIAIVLLAPMLAVIGLAVKLQDGGPVLFRQRRVGRGNKHFWCYKFRTMLVQAEASKVALQSLNEQDGPVFKIRKDPRVTPLGRFLRKYSLDELPQLFNVLAGNMSMVGPRPPTPDEVERYEWWQRRRVSVQPGITCIWQVSGRNRVTFKRWVEMDLFYIDNWSLWLDLKLMLQTVMVVVRGTGS